jgi:hypothetical protein
MKKTLIISLILQACITFFSNSQSFINADGMVPALTKGSSSFGDLDKDGDFDLIQTGINQPSTGMGVQVVTVYINNNGTFDPFPTSIPVVQHAQTDIADYDNDGDIDMEISTSC